MSIGDVAAAGRVSVEAIRYYESEGLLPKPRRDATGRRRYPAGVVLQLEIITTLRSVGFGVRDIEQLMAVKAGTADLDERLARARTVLARFDEQLAHREGELQRARAVIAEFRRELG